MESKNKKKNKAAAPIHTTIKNSKGGEIPLIIYDKTKEPAEYPPRVAEQIRKAQKTAEFWGITPERTGELDFLAEYAVRHCVEAAARRPDNTLCQYNIPETEPGTMSEKDREIVEQMEQEKALEMEYLQSIKRPETATEYGYYYREIVKGLEDQYKAIAKGYYSGLDYLYSVEPFRDYDLTAGELFPDELLPGLIEKQIAKKDKTLRELEPLAAKVPELREHIADLRAERDRLLAAFTQSQKENESQKDAGEMAVKSLEKAAIILDQKRKKIEISIFKAAQIIAEEAKKMKIRRYCTRGAYVSIATNEKNIRNWENMRNPCPWPDGFPSRWQPEETFRILVRRGLEGYINRILEGRRHREQEKLRVNLGGDDPDHFYGVSLDNPPDQYKAIANRVHVKGSVDDDENPGFIYYDEQKDDE